MTDRPPVLVVPDELHLARAARHRLARQLGAAPPEVQAVVALVEPLGSCASAESHAERRCFEAFDATTRVEGGAFRGAVLARADATVRCLDDEVVVEAGPVVVDRGAVAHDPWAPAEPLPADPSGRPPFPRRPVVVALAGVADIGVADVARSWVNGLVRLDVEGRLAVPEIPEGLHLTRPCPPGPDLLDVLVPDVVVALDPVALATAMAWRGGARGTTVVELSHDVGTEVAMLPWQVGDGRRLRARVGRLASPAAVAQLVNRLCSGPQPSSPTDPAPDEVRVPEPLLRHAPTHVASRSAPTSAARRIEVAGVVAPGSAAAGLLDHLRRAGHEVTAADAVAGAPAISPAPASPAADGDVVRLRVRGGRSGRDEVVVGVLEPQQVAALTPARTRHLATHVDAVVVPSRHAADELGSGVAHMHVVRPLLPTADTTALQRRRRRPAGPPVVGWRIGDDGGAVPAHLGAVTPAVRAALDLHGARVEVVGAWGVLPLDLRQDDRVTHLDRPATSAHVGEWHAQVWSPPDGWLATTGDSRPLLAALHGGVPTVLGAPDAAAAGGLALDELTVSSLRDADEWRDVLSGLLVDGSRRAPVDRGRAVAEALGGQWAAQVAIDRLLGWLDRVPRTGSAA